MNYFFYLSLIFSSSSKCFSKNNLNNASLVSPFILDEDWEILKEENFENDSLLIARRKELCLQEL